MVNVNWSFTVKAEEWSEESLNIWADSVETEVLALSALSRDVVDTRKNVVFLKCPAHTDFMKNTFVFKSPLDISLDIDVNDQFAKVWSRNLDQAIFNKIIDLRFLSLSEAGTSPYPIIGIDFLNAFTCSSPMLVSITPAYLHFNDFTTKTSVIPGTYDISRWTRPIECVFEVKSNCEQIEIKKGDALFYVKFESTVPVKLVKANMPWNEIDLCAKLRAEEPFKPLRHRYASRSNYQKS